MHNTVNVSEQFSAMPAAGGDDDARLVALPVASPGRSPEFGSGALANDGCCAQFPTSLLSGDSEGS